MFCDNLSAVLLAANPILHNKTKHFELDLYFVHDQVSQKKAFVVHIPSLEQVVDILTKSLIATSFIKFRSKLKSSTLLHTEFMGG